jgi:hypothetical protein
MLIKERNLNALPRCTEFFLDQEALAAFEKHWHRKQTLADTTSD